MLKYLAARHEITLVSYVRGDQSADIAALRQFCREVVAVPIERKASLDALALSKSLLTGEPWIIVRDDRAAMRTAVRQAAQSQQFDIVQADQLNMAQFARLVPGAHKVVDTHNALWLLYKRMAATTSGPKGWLFSRDWRLMRRYEAKICREFDAVTAVSEEDKAALVDAGADPAKITVIPIAVDCDLQVPIELSSAANHILSIGTMYWPPNVDGIRWFIQEIYPLIRQQRPDVVFDVVGAHPPEEITRLGGNGTGVNVSGYVEDTTPFVRQAAAVVVPLRAGGGMRVKILNAMTQGLPVVSTTIGAEGIAAQDGCHLLLADTPADFARAVLRLLDDRVLARQLGQNGRTMVAARYDYRVAYAAYDEVYSNGNGKQ